ncbi:MAG: isoleucine--tRNA ligase [Sphingopyxis sp.]|nr:isoleucine--tRNA ligase [Sphingopyxis sp.]
MTEAKAPVDYRDTVFLPTTDFPMKAGLPQKEPAIAAKWEAEKLYDQLRDARRGRPKFMYHDGPPYANGDMHIGHALNHTIKDMVCRTQNLLGRDAPYVPGWDCHGLPIEWKVEEQYRKKKQDKDQIPLLEFRAECRAYAQHWVDVQRSQLKRLGIMADWDHPYLTMQPESEATIVAELLKLAADGQLYRGAKPVMWSPVEKTALAEAEVEYEDITSTQIDVAFEIVESPIPELVGAHAVIWTTTPWTIPVNQAIAYGPDVEYVLYECSNYDKAIGRYLIAAELREQFEWRLVSGLRQATGTEPCLVMNSFYIGKGTDLAGTIARHPMAKLFPGEGRGPSPEGATLDHGVMDPRLRGGTGEQGENNLNPTSPLAEFFLRPRPFLPGDFVTTDSGTGLVHMAPDHGEDDFDLCKAHGLNPVFAVEGDGKYRADWAWLGGQGSVINPKFNAPDGPICTDLRAAGALLAASADYQHSYPHSWRSKAKVIYRCTPQWFVPMDKPLADGRTLRQTATAEIARVAFTPDKGRNRIGSMVEGRPDWVLSRQRAWGVPITLFVNKKTGDYLVDPEVNARIVAAVRAQGIDAWTPETAHSFLGDAYNADDWEAVPDILDVWFDSGTSHAYVLESGRWPDLSWPADIYVEGSDQHRGWFQSSLLHSCATRGRAPYNQILTHGFTMDAKGMKMSKSLGNTVDPNKVMETYGADIIRLWALSVDFTEDHRIGDEILKGVGDQYRKLRNTFRYLLGALDGFGEDERVAVADMPELERYMLHLLAQLDATLKQAAESYDFNSYTRALSDFCNEDLSAFYFDIRKDSLYCDIGPAAPLGTAKRRAYRTVLDTLFHALIRYAAPVLVFTAEEVWGTRYPDGGSVHLLEWPVLPNLLPGESRGPSPDGAATTDPEMGPGFRRGTELLEKWEQIRASRMLINELIEPMRRDKIIRSSLEAEVTHTNDVGNLDYAEILIVSSAKHGGETKITRTTHHKCGRCWRHLPEVTEDGTLCNRCTDVLG